MMLAMNVALWVVTVVLLIPAAVLVVEAWASLLPRRRKATLLAGARPGCAVLVPAHNEEAGIEQTVTALQQQLHPGDRIVVVADNCTDQTATAARSCGAWVVERNDPDRRGKGFALDFGVRFLEVDPPAVVLIVDADCLVEAGAVGRLVQETVARGRPVQAAYVAAPRMGAGTREQLSAFALRYKNLVRPLGLDRLGLPCLLTGTGMAFPWPVLRDARLADGNIVEDMQLGLDLALTGQPIAFCPEALVSSELPAGMRAAVRQRTRWEHGHLRTLLNQVPRLLGAAVRQRRLDLAGLALELSVPPLSMLFLLWGTTLAGLVCWWLAGGMAGPVLVLGGGILAVFLSIFAAWARFGREDLPFTSLLAAPFYVLWKVPIYLAFLLRPERTWVRTERNSAPTLHV
jgi:cellulose synthase/poly-beta-1,6-N-acetylglucosamine synthase-like glycosyltransferase